MATLHHKRYKLRLLLKKSLFSVNLSKTGLSTACLNFSRLNACPAISAYFYKRSSDKISNDSKYRKTAQSLLSSQAMVAKMESFLIQNEEFMDSADTKVQIQEVAVLTNAVAVDFWPCRALHRGKSGQCTNVCPQEGS